VDVITYFKELAEETGIPYQNLINLYLRDCVASGRKPSLGNSAYRSAMAKGHAAARVTCTQFGRLRGTISYFGSREVGCRESWSVRARYRPGQRGAKLDAVQ
jgi:hypothetical protein